MLSLWCLLLGLLLGAGVQVSEAQAGGGSYKIASVEHKPYLFLSDDAKSGNARYSGYIKDLLDELAKTLNFRYELVFPEDGKYGAYDEASGKWTGMVGMVADGGADLIAADLTVTAKRTDALDFSSPFLTAPLTILTSKNARAMASAEAFSSVLTYDAWIIVILSFVLTGIVLWLVARISPYEQVPRVSEEVFTLANSYWFIFSCFFRGSNYTPQTLSTRILAAGWWLFGLCVLLTFAVSFQAFLQVDQATPNYKVTDISTLIANENFEFKSVKGGSTEAFLKGSANPQHQEMWRRISANPESNLINGYEEGVTAILQGGGSAGIVIEEKSAETYTSMNCALYTVGNLLERSYALGFRRGSPARNQFTQGILQLRNTGKLQTLEDKWWSGGLDCDDEDPTDPSGQTSCTPVAFQVGLDVIYPPFTLLIILLLVALIVSIVELIVFVWSNPSDDKKSSLFAARLKHALCGCCGSRHKESSLPTNAE